MRVPTNRTPMHPCEMLREEFLIPMNLAQKVLADASQVPYQRINEIISGKSGIIPSTALRLAKFFGMSADFWLNLQVKFDLFSAQKNGRSDFEENQATRILNSIDCSNIELVRSRKASGFFVESFEFGMRLPKTPRRSIIRNEKAPPKSNH